MENKLFFFLFFYYWDCEVDIQTFFFFYDGENLVSSLLHDFFGRQREERSVFMMIASEGRNERRRYSIRCYVPDMVEEGKKLNRRIVVVYLGNK